MSLACCLAVSAGDPTLQGTPHTHNLAKLQPPLAAGDPTYREWGWSIFRAFEMFCKLPSGGLRLGQGCAKGLGKAQGRAVLMCQRAFKPDVRVPTP